LTASRKKRLSSAISLKLFVDNPMEPTGAVLIAHKPQLLTEKLKVWSQNSWCLILDPFTNEPVRNIEHIALSGKAHTKMFNFKTTE